MIPSLRLLALPDRDRRTLTRGATTLLLILVLGRGVPAWHAWRARTLLSSRSECTELARSLALLSARVAERDTLQARTARLQALRGALLAGATPAAQGALLAAIVSNTADSAHILLGAVDVQPDTARDAFTSIHVRGSATGDIRGLTSFLVDLESSVPHLAVRSIAFTQPDPAAPHDRAESIHLDFLVEGMGATATGASGVR